ncbi:MAG: M24 family metallopeptidase [Armatimonadota bacterium]
MGRVELFQQELSRRGEDAAIITAMENIRYLTGHYVWTSYSPTTFAIIPAKEEPVLCVPEPDETLARSASRVRIEPYNPGPRGFRAAAELSRRVLGGNGTSPGTLGLEFPSLTIDRFRILEETFPEWRLNDVTAVLTGLRLVKDQEEQLAFRHAAEIAGLAMRKTMQALSPGISELELKGTLDLAAYTEAARRWPEAVVISQANALSGEKLNRLHDAARGRTVSAGEAVFVLAHINWNGYWANISRTLFVPGGHPDADARRLLDAVVGAQRNAIEQLRPGQALGAASSASDTFLATRGLAEKKIYPMFRGLGLRYDEPPRALDLDMILRPGMCLAVAVHLRSPRFIVGQGDSVLITDTAAEILSDRTQHVN